MKSFLSLSFLILMYFEINWKRSSNCNQCEIYLSVAHFNIEYNFLCFELGKWQMAKWEWDYVGK